ncbi:MAG: Flp pilus assembly protein CpaB, partial [Proteobacteria bacterium]|nr:Flp pilus assembly protein CpaB [Pseudomonadota bacterium]
TIIAGEPITGVNVIYKKNFNSLNTLLKPGMRAMSVFLPSVTLGGGAFKAGQTIDLNITLSKKGSRDFITQTALCNTRILSIGQNNISSKYSKNADKEDKLYLVILEVTPNQAKSLTTALKMGTPSLVLHPPQKDQEQCVETDFGTEEDSQTVEVIKAG